MNDPSPSNGEPLPPPESAAPSAAPPAAFASPRVVPYGEHPLRREMISREALFVMDRLHEAGYKGYLCGGGVRDLLLGIAPKDFDVATDARPEEIRRVFRNCRIIGRRFRLAHVFFRNGTIIETATFRALLAGDEEAARAAEEAPLPSRRKPFAPDPTYATREGLVVRDNVYGTAEEDARRRDFTVNGLFFDVADGSILDYVGGLDDLAARVLRVIGEPAGRFREDPVRMIRAVRIASQLDFAIEPEAYAAARENAAALAGCSHERMYEEVLKIRRCGHARETFRRGWGLGLFQAVHPAAAAQMQGEEGAALHAWVDKAFGQFDRWRAAGLEAMPALQYALLFGPFIEREAAALAAKGMGAFEAMETATAAVLRAPGDLTQIPKAVVLDAQLIMTLQGQLARAGEGSRYAERLRTRRGFDLAMVYLKFAASLDPARKPLLDRWMAGPIPETDWSGGSPRRPRRRGDGRRGTARRNASRR